MLIITFLLISLSSLVAGFPGAADRIISPIPTLDRAYQSRLTGYSGFLSAGNGTHLHYVFYEALNDSANAPLMLWLNGGPGCSSLFGLADELGPWIIQGDGTVKPNEYSWIRLANIIFLESPANVGFSYSERLEIHQDDNTTVEFNMQALRTFYRKFPQFRKNKFFLSGESYAGVYIPTLAARLVNESDFHVDGLLIGNGYFEPDLQENALFHYLYFHGMFSTEIYKNVMSTCCPEMSDIRDCKLTDSKDLACSELYHRSVYTESHGIIYRNINYYDIYGNIDFNKQGRIMTNFMNKPEVLKALNIPGGRRPWEDCNDDVLYSYVQLYRKSSQYDNIHRVITSGNVPILIYAGDTDLVCNTIGNSWFVEKLGLKPIGDREPYIVKRPGRGFAPDQQIVGYRQFYEKNVVFLNVRGAGHMVPEKQWASFQFVKDFFDRYV